MKKPLLLLISALMSACAIHTGSSLQLPARLSTFSPETPIACHYEKQVFTTGHPPSSPTDWYFWRDEHHTETRDEASRQGDLWERDGREQLTYTRIFLDEKATLEYSSVDLLTSGMTPPWQQLRSLVDPKALGAVLKRQPGATRSGLVVEHYTGTLDGMVTNIDWLPRLQLPARLEKKTGQGGFSLRLTTCHPLEKAAWKPGSLEARNRFRALEYTDLGDMESDPQVKRLLDSMGEQAHAHHQGQGPQ